MTAEKEQTVRRTGVSWPGPATEQNDSGTGVLSPGPSLRQKHPKGSTRDSRNNSLDRYDYRDKWTDVWKSDHNRWIHGWNEHYHDDNWTDTWRKRNPGDEWRTSRLETSSCSSSHWETNPPSKRGWWVGPGVCIGTHRGSVWVNMRGSLWKCSQLQCKVATTEESRGLETQNQLLDDMKAEFQEFLGRRVYTDVEREGIPPSDADRPPAAPRVVQEEEDRTSALIPTLPLVTSPPPSLPELDSESHRSFREAPQGENELVPSDISSHLDSGRSHRTTSQTSRNQSWSMPRLVT